jgi:hypothetical protein
MSIQAVDPVCGQNFIEYFLPARQIEISARAALGHFHHAIANRSASAFDVAHHFTDQIRGNHGMAAHGQQFQNRIAG